MPSSNIKASDVWWMENYSNSDYFLSHDGRSLENIDEEVKFIEIIAGKNKNRKIADFGCADGMHLNELYRRGYRNLFGIDLSEYMLDRARQQEDLPGSIEWINGDFRTSPHIKVDIALSLYNSVGFFVNADDNLAHLNAIKESTVKGGTIVIDFFPRESWLRDFVKQQWREVSGVIILKDNAFDPITSRVIRRTTVLKPNGARSERVSSVQVYTIHEMMGLIEKIGCKVERLMVDFADQNFDLGQSNRVQVISKIT